MGKTYYNSTLTDAQIQQVLDAINNILTPSNNGKVLAISGGTLEARSVQWGGGGGYPEPTGTILLTQNGIQDVKDYAEANVQVQGGSSIEVIPLTATANAVYTAPTGKAYSPVTVNVSDSTIIANWDFTQSLIDSVNGFEATLSGATRDSNGVTIAAASDRIILPKCLQGFLRTFEIDVGAITGAAGTVFFISRSGDGIGYNNGSWKLYSGSWDVATNVTALDAFANGVIKIYIDEIGKWHIYKDDVLLWTSTKTLPPADSTITIGYTSNSLRTMVIKSIKVY